MPLEQLALLLLAYHSSGAEGPLSVRGADLPVDADVASNARALAGART
jgi:hypothetical protein